MGDVIQLDVPVGDEIAIDPDTVLENSKGALYDNNGEFHVRATHGSREVLWMLNRAIVHLMLETE